MLQSPRCFNTAFALGALALSFSGSFAEASWRHLSQFVLFLHFVPNRLMMLRSLCGALAVVRQKKIINLTVLLQLMAKLIFVNAK